MSKHTDQRWRAVIVYRLDASEKVDVEHFFEEISDLEEIVERGPDWNAIESISINLNRTASYSTIEEAAVQ